MELTAAQRQQIIEGTIGIAVEIRLFRAKIALLTEGDASSMMLGMLYYDRIQIVRLALQSIENFSLNGGNPRHYYLGYYIPHTFRYIDMIAKSQEWKVVVEA